MKGPAVLCILSGLRWETSAPGEIGRRSGRKCSGDSGIRRCAAPLPTLSHFAPTPIVYLILHVPHFGENSLAAHQDVVLRCGTTNQTTA